MKKLRITVDGKSYDVEVEVLGGKVASIAPSAAPVSAHVSAPAAPAAPAAKPVVKASAGSKDIASPLAAVVVSVDVKEGQQVKAGDTVVTLEAMKMNTPVNATCDGTVAKIAVSAGQSVEEGQLLISLS